MMEEVLRRKEWVEGECVERRRNFRETEKGKIDYGYTNSVTAGYVQGHGSYAACIQNKASSDSQHSERIVSLEPH